MSRNPQAYNKFKKDNCEACGSSWPLLDIDHIKTIGSGGTNDAWNCMTLCRMCHIIKGQRGIKYMTDKYPSYLKWLATNGWEFFEFKGKWVHV